MRLSLARLRPRHIALLTVAYWLGLVVVACPMCMAGQPLEDAGSAAV